MHLPPEEVTVLRYLRGSNYEMFKARMRDLRARGWTYASMSEPFGSPRATAQAWCTRALSTSEIPEADDVPSPPRKDPGAYRIANIRPKVPHESAERLRSLSQTARKVRGWTDEDAPERTAAVELEDEIARLSDAGVSYADIARAMGVTYRAVAARMERRGERVSELSRAKEEVGSDGIVATA